MSNKEECGYCEEVGEEGSFFYCKMFDYHVCAHCVREYYLECKKCGETTHNEHCIFDGNEDEYYCEECADDYEEWAKDFIVSK